jgi:hypothetical protein
MIKAGAMSMKMDIPKSVAGLASAFVAAPAFANIDALSTMPLSNEVTFAAYLAVLLGTFVPVTFLIVLYSQVRHNFILCRDPLPIVKLTSFRFLISFMYPLLLVFDVHRVRRARLVSVRVSSKSSTLCYV